MSRPELPENQKQWFNSKTMDDLRKYNSGNLHNGKDIWDLFKEVKEFLWAMYSAYIEQGLDCLLYTSPSPRDLSTSRMPSSA